MTLTFIALDEPFLIILRSRWVRTDTSSEMMPGDILWKQNHTEIYIGDGKTVGAHCDENGGIAGTNRGDQTGHEIDVGDVGSWYYVFRKG